MDDPRAQGLYPTEIIANICNLSERRIEQLVKKRIIPKVGRGVFDLGPAVSAYIRYLQGLCQGSLKDTEPSELDRRFQEARVLERESKARQAKCKADKMEQELTDSRIRKGLKELPAKVKTAIRHYDPQLVELVMLEIEDAVKEILGDAE